MTKTATVKELAEQIRGVTYAKSDASDTPGPDLVPVLRAGNITDNGLVCDRDLVYVPESKVSAKQRIRKHDIVIAASSGSISIVGKAAQAREDLSGSFGAFCKVLRPNENVEPNYFSHYFKTPSYRRHVSTLAAGANINNLRNQDLDNLVIPLPPLSEQKRIAEILDRAEALRAKRRAALALLDELTQSIFLDMFGDPVSNPMGWTIRSLTDVLSMPLRNGLSPSKSGKVLANVLTLSAITGSAFDPIASKESTFVTKPPANQSVDKSDFLICRGNGNVNLVGRGFFPKSSMPDTTFPDTMIAARIDTQVERPFLELLWNSRSVRNQIEASARTTNGTYKVNQTMLEAVNFICPPLELQNRFTNRTGAIAKQKDFLQSSLRQLDQLFASLQHRAFRGEL